MAKFKSILMVMLVMGLMFCPNLFGQEKPPDAPTGEPAIAQSVDMDIDNTVTGSTEIVLLEIICQPANAVMIDNIERVQFCCVQCELPSEYSESNYPNPFNYEKAVNLPDNDVHSKQFYERSLLRV